MANSSFGTFQVNIAVTNTAQQVEAPGTSPGSGNPPINSMVLRAAKANVGKIWIGGSSTQASSANGMELSPGDAVGLDIQGGGRLWVLGEANDKLQVAWVGP